MNENCLQYWGPKTYSTFCLSQYPAVHLQFTQIQPHFDYCSAIWGNWCKTLDAKLPKLQNRVARVLTFSSYDTSADYLFKLLGWKKNWISNERFKELLWSINHLTALIISVLNLWTVAAYQPIHEETQRANFAFRFLELNFKKKELQPYAGAVLWNSIQWSSGKLNPSESFRVGCRRYFS